MCCGHRYQNNAHICLVGTSQSEEKRSDHLCCEQEMRQEDTQVWHQNTQDCQCALEIDKENGDMFWTNAIKKEMKNVCTAFDVVDEKDIPNECQCINCHMAFDVKMEANFRQKARLVAGGHQTD